MAIVAPGYAVVSTGGLDLFIFYSAELQSGFLVTRLEKAASPSAAEVVGTVWGHVNEVFFTHAGLYNVAQVFCNGISVAFSYNLAGILNGEFDFQVFVPVRIYLELAFPDPFGVIFIDIFYFKVVFDVEFWQSGPDCESDVPSFGIEKRLAPQFMGLVC